MNQEFPDPPRICPRRWTNYDVCLTEGAVGWFRKNGAPNQEQIYAALCQQLPSPTPRLLAAVPELPAIFHGHMTRTLETLAKQPPEDVWPTCSQLAEALKASGETVGGVLREAISSLDEADIERLVEIYRNHCARVCQKVATITDREHNAPAR